MKQFLDLSHLLALAACISSSIPMLVKVLLCAVCCAHYFFIISRLDKKHYIIKHSVAQGWEIMQQEDFVSIQIEHSTVVSLLAVFLHFRTEDNVKKTLVLVNDSLTELDFRRFIVRLKTSA
jgi:hypothetical protein